MDGGRVESLIYASKQWDVAQRVALLEACGDVYGGSPDVPACMFRMIRTRKMLKTDRSLHAWERLLLAYVGAYPRDADTIEYAVSRMVSSSGVHERHGVLGALLRLAPRAAARAILRQAKSRVGAARIRLMLAHWRPDAAAIAALADSGPATALAASLLPSDLGLMLEFVGACGPEAPDAAVWAVHRLLSGKTADEALAEAAGRRYSGGPEAELLRLYKACAHRIAAGGRGPPQWPAQSKLEYRPEYRGGETVEEAERRDGLRIWMGGLMRIRGMRDLARKFDSDLDRTRRGLRRKDGHVWHAELARLLHERGNFWVEAVEKCNRVDGSGYDVDIELQEPCNPYDRINVQAWCGGRYSGLGGKAAQLPPDGRCFVVQRAHDGEQACNGSSLPPHVCLIQACGVAVRVCMPEGFRHRRTAMLIAETLGVPVESGTAPSAALPGCS